MKAKRPGQVGSSWLKLGEIGGFKHENVAKSNRLKEATGNWQTSQRMGNIAI